MNLSPKRTFVTITTLGLAVLVVAGIAVKDRIVEEWYLWRFEQAEGEEK